MDDWFTVEEIDRTTFAISEYGHWEEPHCYLLIGTQKAALIDTGLGVGKISVEVKNLTSLPVLAIITHAHWDHVGGVNEFDDVAIHKNDAGWLRNGLPISDSLIQANFAQSPTTKPIPKSFNLKKYTTPHIEPDIILEGGEAIDLGDRVLQVIHTPGHSPGSICIFESKRGHLFTGDTLYQGTLFMNYESTDPVAFANSINKLSHLKPIMRILPGHHKLAIEQSLLVEADVAFAQLKKLGALVHGSGLHKFKNLEILI